MKKQTTAIRRDFTYGGYLHLADILGAQALRSSPPAHDEMLFIIVHQAFELWFKQMLHEVDSLLAVLSSSETARATRSFTRLNEIIKVLDAQLRVLETMSPTDFNKFRELLKPASGFQSWQFRELEFSCGAKEERYLRIFEDDAVSKRKLEARLAAPSLWQAFCLLLKNRGYGVTTEDEQRDAIVRAYREDRDPALVSLCEAMIEFDELFALWREHHVRMAERMIGEKPGTGQHHVEYSLGKSAPLGTMGVEYLKSTLNKRFFPILWAARSQM